MSASGRTEVADEALIISLLHQPLSKAVQLVLRPKCGTFSNANRAVSAPSSLL